MRRRSNGLLLLWTTLLLTGFAAADPGEPAEAALLDRLANITTLRADYRQIDSRQQVQTGRVWLKKPGHFRVESDAPLSQVIVSNNETLWTFDVDLEQLIISDVHRRIEESPVLLFAGDPAEITAAYRVETFSDDDHDYFLLRPRSEAGLLSGVALTFRGPTPIRITVENTMGDTTAIDLLAVATFEQETGLFSFDAPPGVDVIDDRVP